MVTNYYVIVTYSILEPLRAANSAIVKVVVCDYGDVMDVCGEGGCRGVGAIAVW